MRSFLTLHRPPKWNVAGGIWYSVPRNSHSSDLEAANRLSMIRWKPAVCTICDPLMGTHVCDKDGNTFVSYPRYTERHRIYREGIELLIVFRDSYDAVTLALYRRQVTRRGDIPLDELFLSVCDTLSLTDTDWLDIAQRMPDRSLIRKESFLRADGYRPTESMAIAAE